MLTLIRTNQEFWCSAKVFHRLKSWLGRLHQAVAQQHEEGRYESGIISWSIWNIWVTHSSEGELESGKVKAWLVTAENVPSRVAEASPVADQTLFSTPVRVRSKCLLFYLMPITFVLQSFERTTRRKTSLVWSVVNFSVLTHIYSPCKHLYRYISYFTPLKTTSFSNTTTSFNNQLPMTSRYIKWMNQYKLLLVKKKGK